ncbi:helix-turn-helix transcriptional regulator [Nanoarchaeota archaeon]
MNQKQIGIILIIAGIVLAGIVFGIKAKEDAYISTFIQQEGTCYLDDGTCLHEDRDFTVYVIGWVFSGVLILFGVYIGFIDKTQQVLAEHQIKVSSALKEHKQLELDEEKFSILLKGLDVDEKKVVKAVKEQDGITQQTLRLRTDLHKSKLSIILDGLEKKNLIKRVAKGKTKQVFLKIAL